ncbi:enoyl-CoA hydratase/isomerase family protein, partial [bacterium]|nr:enoyl-CoA hydratase/isomerase family protein [bacterium]
MKTLRLDLNDSGIAMVTLNRPEKLNAMNSDMRHEFGILQNELLADDRVKVIIFTGAGRAFSAGGDIDFLDQDWSTPRFRQETQAFTGFFDALESVEKP